jgi:hypothetical protein
VQAIILVMPVALAVTLHQKKKKTFILKFKNNKKKTVFKEYSVFVNLLVMPTKAMILCV